MLDENALTKIRLHHETHGQGDPLLCIHGYGGSLYSWREFVKPNSPLINGYRVITIDLKGFGKSPKPRDTFYSSQNHADLLYQFIQEHDLKNLTLIGNSFGGGLSVLLAIMLAERDPNRLRSLVLIDAGVYPDLMPFYLKLTKLPLLGEVVAHLAPGKFAVWFVLRVAYYDPRKITREQIATYAAPMTEVGARHALLQTARQIIPPNFDELRNKFKEIRVPALVIWGKQDRIISRAAGLRLNQDLPNSALHEFEKCGHIPQEERPDETISLIARFLQNVYAPDEKQALTVQNSPVTRGRDQDFR